MFHTCCIHCPLAIVCSPDLAGMRDQSWFHCWWSYGQSGLYLIYIPCLFEEAAPQQALIDQLPSPSLFEVFQLVCLDRALNFVSKVYYRSTCPLNHSSHLLDLYNPLVSIFPHFRAWEQMFLSLPSIFWLTLSLHHAIWAIPGSSTGNYSLWA